MVSGNENTGRAKLLWRKNANSKEINERATTDACGGGPVVAGRHCQSPASQEINTWFTHLQNRRLPYKKQHQQNSQKITSDEVPENIFFE